MLYVAPEEYAAKRTLFLAGGITGCPDWQKEAIELFDTAKVDIEIFNPRRPTFDVTKAAESMKQIAWEYRHLRKAEAVLFWFCKETLCPIVLFELGAWSMTRKPIFVGVEPGYKRGFDVEFQLRLARPDVKVVWKLDELVRQVKQWAAPEVDLA